MHCTWALGRWWPVQHMGVGQMVACPARLHPPPTTPTLKPTHTQRGLQHACVPLAIRCRVSTLSASFSVAAAASFSEIWTVLSCAVLRAREGNPRDTTSMYFTRITRMSRAACCTSILCMAHYATHLRAVMCSVSCLLFRRCVFALSTRALGGLISCPTNCMKLSCEATEVSYW